MLNLVHLIIEPSVYICHCKTVCFERSDMGVGPSAPFSGGPKSHSPPEFPALEGLSFVVYLSHPGNALVS